MFHPSQLITFLEKNTDNVMCVFGDGSIESRSVEYDRQVLLQLPVMYDIVQLFQWWQARKGMKGIDAWFKQLCLEREWDPKSLTVRPHLKAKVCLSDTLIWNKYVERLEKKKQLVQRMEMEPENVRKRKRRIIRY